MGVKIRRKGDKWYVFVDFQGRRKAKCVGTKAAAEKVKQVLEAKLALGDMAIFQEDAPKMPTFAAYADQWLRTDALRNKASTIDFYRDYQRRYVLPKFGQKKLNE